MAEGDPHPIFWEGGVARGSTTSLYHKILIITTDYCAKFVLEFLHARSK